MHFLFKPAAHYSSQFHWLPSAKWTHAKDFKVSFYRVRKQPSLEPIRDLSGAEESHQGPPVAEVQWLRSLPQSIFFSPILKKRKPTNFTLHQPTSWAAANEIGSNNTKKKLRGQYFRYADDWVLFLNCHPDKILEIKNIISEWITKNLKQKLSIEKTKITNISKEPVRFLGFAIGKYPHRRKC